jgi:hypothetical protein
MPVSDHDDMQVMSNKKIEIIKKSNITYMPAMVNDNM